MTQSYLQTSSGSSLLLWNWEHDVQGKSILFELCGQLTVVLFHNLPDASGSVSVLCFFCFGRDRKPLFKVERMVAVIAQAEQCKSPFAADIDGKKPFFHLRNSGQAFHSVIQCVA